MPTIKEILQTMDYGPAPESTKEAQAWLDQHGRRFGLFIDNAWSEAARPSVRPTRPTAANWRK
jgi:aldehyde dehydrogenase (NAD+)